MGIVTTSNAVKILRAAEVLYAHSQTTRFEPALGLRDAILAATKQLAGPAWTPSVGAAVHTAHELLMRAGAAEERRIQRDYERRAAEYAAENAGNTLPPRPMYAGLVENLEAHLNRAGVIAWIQAAISSTDFTPAADHR